MSQVDLPYFRELVKNLDINTEWFVSYYNPNERQTKFKVTSDLGISEEKIKLIRIQSLANSAAL